MSCILSPTNLIYFTEEQYQQLWFPAHELFPCWHHARIIKNKKPVSLESLTLASYQDHSEHQVIARVMQQILTSHQITLKVKKIDYDQQHTGRVENDIWLDSTNSTLPLDFSIFVHLYEVPLLRHCIPINWQTDAARWRDGEVSLVNWCRQLVASEAVVPLLHHWLIIQGQRSIRGLRVNTFGWLGFKSAWPTPPGPRLPVDNKITTLAPFSAGCHTYACVRKMPVEPDPDNAGEGI